MVGVVKMTLLNSKWKALESISMTETIGYTQDQRKQLRLFLCNESGSC